MSLPSFPSHIYSETQSREVRRVQDQLLRAQDFQEEQDAREQMLNAAEIEDTESQADEVAARAVGLPEDTIGMAVCSLTRDTYFMTGYGLTPARLIRTLTSLLLLLLTIVTQVWLLAIVKEFVCAKAVHSIRIAYDMYELAMYGAENCTLTVNGHHRGLPGMFPPMEEAQARLSALSEADREEICNIPTSHPCTFGLIIFLWTLRCLAELERAFGLQLTILMLPNCHSMSEAMSPAAARGDDDEEGGIINAMTITMKVILTLFTFFPRIGINMYLLWVGCRWLFATNDYESLVLNALALAFIHEVKESFYVAIAPPRNKHDLVITTITPYPRRMSPPGWESLLRSVLFLFVSLLWVFLYIVYFQQVLPDYKWDLGDVCEVFTAAQRRAELSRGNHPHDLSAEHFNYSAVR